MSRVIYKQILPLGYTEHTIEIPARSVFISAENQKECLCVWYECTPGAKASKRKIYVIETGKEKPDLQVDFLGTVLFDRGNYVVHVYVRKNEELT